MSIKRSIIKKNQLMATLAISTAIAVAGAVLYVSDQQSSQFKSDAEYVMTGENKSFNSYKPKNNTPRSDYIDTEMEVIESESFSPSYHTSSSSGSSLSASGSVMSYGNGSDRVSSRQSSNSSGGSSVGGMMAVGARKSGGFTTSTPNMMGASSKGSTSMSDPFDMPKQKGINSWDDLTPPGDDNEELGPPLPVGNGLCSLLIMGLAYLFIHTRKFIRNQETVR